MNKRNTTQQSHQKNMEEASRSRGAHGPLCQNQASPKKHLRWEKHCKWTSNKTYSHNHPPYNFCHVVLINVVLTLSNNYVDINMLRFQRWWYIFKIATTQNSCFVTSYGKEWLYRSKFWKQSYNDLYPSYCDTAWFSNHNSCNYDQCETHSYLHRR